SAGRSMDIAIEKMSIAEKLLAIQRLWNSLQQEEIRTPLVWLEHVLNEHLQALHEGQAGFSPLEEVAQRLRRPRA
ncbi:MAG: addiction module protein, partial [Planctomyces sp.]